MRKTLITAAMAITVSAVCAYGAIVSTTSSNPTQLAVTVNWNPENPNPELGNYADAWWSWDVTFSKTATQVLATISGQHLAPAGPIFNTVLAVPLAFGVDADAATLAEPGAYDTWTAVLIRNDDFLPLVLSIGATHTVVPEPTQVAWFAGLGLMAFGAYRRNRRV